MSERHKAGYYPMARRVRDARLETRSARLRLAVRKKPFAGPQLARGVHQYYRRNHGPGSWVAKIANGRGGYYEVTLKGVIADDYEDSTGDGRVMSFLEAQPEILKLAHGKPGEAGGERPATVDEALNDYAKHLKANGGDPYNATRARNHLPASLLGKPVALLTARELRKWRDGLQVAPATVNRTCIALAAALQHQVELDPRIVNTSAWKVGLRGLADATVADNVVIPDDGLRRILRECYAIDANLGLFFELHVVTSDRTSQLIRLRVEDLQVDRAVLMMPLSKKGGSRAKGARKQPKPIPAELAARLAAGAKGRAPGDPLLVRSDGISWEKYRHRDPFRRAVATAGFDPDAVTPYAARHSSITRMLLKGVPVRLVASAHDTSIQQIERTYSKFITHHGDELLRGALFDVGGGV